MDQDILEGYVAQIRKLSPESKIILGGPSLSENPKMRSLGDYFILGEAEFSITPLLNAIEKGVTDPDIPGVGFYLNGIERRNDAILIKDMNEIPFADWSLSNRYRNDFYMLATQRGCRWRCTFCTYPANEGFKLRYRSVENIRDEIRKNFERLGIHRYMFADSTFTHPIGRCEEILQAISELPFSVEWVAYARVDNLTESLVQKMKKSGVVGLFIGLESGDDRILKKMNKGYNVEHIRQGIALTKKYEIPVTASWVIGFPGETESSIRNTTNIIKELRCEQNMVNTFSLYNTSPAGIRPDAFGLTGLGQNWQHETMSAEKARELTSKLIEELIADEIYLGNIFDFLWLSSVGWSVDKTLQFFIDVQRLWLDQKKSNSLNQDAFKKLQEQCSDLYSRAVQHPIYRPHQLS